MTVWGAENKTAYSTTTSSSFDVDAMGDHQPPPNPNKAQATAEPQLTPVSASGKVYQDTFGRAFSDTHVLAHGSIHARPKSRGRISSPQFFDPPSEEEREEDQSARARPSNRLLHHSRAQSPGGLSGYSIQTSPEVDHHEQSLYRTPSKIQYKSSEDDENSTAAVQPTHPFTALPTAGLAPDTPPWSSQTPISTPMTWSTRKLGIRRDLGTTGVTASNSFLAQMVRARGASSGRATPSAKNDDDDKNPNRAPHDSDFDVSQSCEDSDWDFDAKFDGERELSDGEAGAETQSDAVHGELGTSLSGRTLIDETDDVGDTNAASSGKGKEVDRHALEELSEVGRASPCQDDLPSSTHPSPSRSSQYLASSSPQTPQDRLCHRPEASLSDTSNDPEATPFPPVAEDPSDPAGIAASPASTRKRIEFLIPTAHGPRRCAPGEDDSAEEDHVAGGSSGVGPSTRSLTLDPASPQVPEEPIPQGVSSLVLHRSRATDSAIDARQVAHVAQPLERYHQGSLNESVMGPGTGEGRDVSAFDGPWTIVITVPSHYNAFHQLGEVLHGLVQYWQAAVVHGGPPTPLLPDPRWGLVIGFDQTWPDLWHPLIMEIMICIVWLIIGWLEFVELVYCIGMRLWYGRHVRMRL
ncbi:hypothetical protein FRC01_004428 [Tulasnella sp. 417]|nr:hypothetical protein FRC01_004428 [Tulasnella sp. 417]